MKWMKKVLLVQLMIMEMKILKNLKNICLFYWDKIYIIYLFIKKYLNYLTIY